MGCTRSFPYGTEMRIEVRSVKHLNYYCLMGFRFLGFSCSESSSLGPGHLRKEKKEKKRNLTQLLINTSASDMAILAPENYLLHENKLAQSCLSLGSCHDKRNLAVSPS